MNSLSGARSGLLGVVLSGAGRKSRLPDIIPSPSPVDGGSQWGLLGWVVTGGGLGGFVVVTDVFWGRVTTTGAVLRSRLPVVDPSPSPVRGMSLGCPLLWWWTGGVPGGVCTRFDSFLFDTFVLICILPNGVWPGYIRLAVILACSPGSRGP